ncbi:glycosyltransferase [Streptomyces marispadix]|uniref:Glycosyltransferase n=1 Tax=Streptomyces marispadix TaxID=2922868 RepID=A0ABS9SX31_9ACTN|nr:glycosyltransferase [Streptomyces marispadix]MCH6160835.1 glycosyltransferase [Streptomyces marispadix]
MSLPCSPGTSESPARPAGPAELLDLEVIVPAYNEEHRIEATIRALTGHLRRLPLTSGVRVVDNGSSDRTAECVDRLAALGLPVTVTGCASPGKGAAVARGVLTSRARWTGFCDADLATPAHALDDALTLLREGWQVVVGSRRCAGARMVVRQPLSRRLGGCGFRFLARGLAGPVADTQCGFKFFATAAVLPLFADVTCTRFAFDLEVLARARALGLSTVEFPVAWSDRQGSTFRLVSDGCRAAVDLWRLHHRLARSAEKRHGEGRNEPRHGERRNGVRQYGTAAGTPAVECAPAQLVHAQPVPAKAVPAKAAPAKKGRAS